MRKDSCKLRNQIVNLAWLVLPLRSRGASREMNFAWIGATLAGKKETKIGSVNT